MEHLLLEGIWMSKFYGGHFYLNLIPLRILVLCAWSIFKVHFMRLWKVKYDSYWHLSPIRKRWNNCCVLMCLFMHGWHVMLVMDPLFRCVVLGQVYSLMIYDPVFNKTIHGNLTNLSVYLKNNHDVWSYCLGHNFGVLSADCKISFWTLAGGMMVKRSIL